MKIRFSYAVIPACIILVLWLGSLITRSNMDWYHNELALSPLTPPDWIFPVAWNIIAVCAAISLILIWNRFKRDNLFWLTIFLFVINALLNIGWSYAFFELHQIRAAYWIAIALEITILLIMALAWRRSRTASLLLIPYALWVLFAIYLTYDIWLINVAI